MWLSHHDRRRFLTTGSLFLLLTTPLFGFIIGAPVYPLAIPAYPLVINAPIATKGNLTIEILNSTSLDAPPCLQVITPNGSLSYPSLQQNSTSSWCCTIIPVLEGSYNLTATAKSITNQSLSYSTISTYDKTPPIISVLSFGIDFAFVTASILRIVARNLTEPVTLTCVITTPTGSQENISMNYLGTSRFWSGSLETTHRGLYIATINATDSAGNTASIVTSFNWIRLYTDMSAGATTYTFVSFYQAAANGFPLLLLAASIYTLAMVFAFSRLRHRLKSDS